VRGDSATCVAVPFPARSVAGVGDFRAAGVGEIVGQI